MVKEILTLYLLKKLLGEKRAKKLGVMTQKYITKTAAFIFGLIAIVHTLRFALGFNANVAGWEVPMWVSFVVVVIAGYLSFNLWKIKK